MPDLPDTNDRDDGGPDGGVLSRVRGRTSRTVVAPAAAAAVLVVVGWLWPRWFGGVGASLLGGAAVVLCLLVTGVLARRARLWALAEEIARQWPDPAAGDERWPRATCAEPRALHATGGPSIWRRARKHRRHVLGVRAASGPLAEGQAVTLHGRTDGLLPSAGDELRVCAATPRGPFLLGRPADGALFVADRWSYATP